MGIARKALDVDFDFDFFMPFDRRRVGFSPRLCVDATCPCRAYSPDPRPDQTSMNDANGVN
eukprot:520090-Pyramimonas_sp.AAC.1